MVLITFLFAASLTIIHLYSYKIKFLQKTPRSIWLSFAGGASVSYIFIYLIPELAEGQELFRKLDNSFFQYLTNHIYLISLLGLCLFYGLERYINITKAETVDTDISKKDFWMHILAFAIYNLLIGYLLFHRNENELSNIFLFFIAMGFHFLINDYGLNKHHNALYIHKGRWILSFSILLGWLLGVLINIPNILIYSIIAFLSGGIILNVLKEELPENQKSNFWAFLTGVIIFSTILVFV